MLVDLGIFGLIVSTMGVDVVSFHVLTVRETTISRVRVAITIRMKSWLAEVSSVGTVR